MHLCCPWKNSREKADVVKRNRASGWMNPWRRIFKRCRHSRGSLHNRLRVGWCGCVCVRACAGLINRASGWVGWGVGGEQRVGGYGTQRAPYLQSFSNATTDPTTQRRAAQLGARHGTTRRLFWCLSIPLRDDVTRWRRRASEGGWELWSKARGRDEEAQERISKTTTGQRWRPFVLRDVHHRCLDLRVRHARPHPFAPLIPGRWPPPPPTRHPATAKSTTSATTTSATRLAR